MAITITQQPGTPNYSYNELVYVITSDNINEIEFSFVVDVYVGSTRVSRLLKQPNPVGAGVFDLQSVINDQLGYDLGALGTTTTSSGSESTKTFDIRFGEEYIVNSELSLFADLQSANNITIVKGVREFNEGNFTDNLVIGKLTTVQSPITIHRDDDMTISFYNSTSNITNHTPINIPNFGATYSQTVDGTTYNFNVYDDRNVLGETRFAWFNRLGGIDYFTTDQQQTDDTNVERSSYNGSPIEWGRSTSTNKERLTGNRVFRGGANNYQNTFENNFTSTTRWLTQNEADLVSGIFDSRFVYVQEGTEFKRIEILNNSYTKMKPELIQPNFNYAIQWKYALNKRTI